MASAFTGVKVFSATMYQDREMLGEKVTSWLNEKAGAIDVNEIMVRQSSDNAFHCVALIVFYTHRELVATSRSDDGKLILEQTFTQKDDKTIALKSVEVKAAPRRLNFAPKEKR